MSLNSDSQFFQAGHRQFPMKIVTNPVDQIEIVLQISNGDRYPGTYKIEFSNSETVALIRTVLELECVLHLMNRSLDLKYWLGLPVEQIPNFLSPWFWVDDLPRDHEIDEHHEISTYFVYHYDSHGIKTQMDVQSSLCDIISKIKNLNARPKYNFDTYRVSCEVIIEQEMIAMNLAQNHNEQRSNTFKI